MPLPFVHPRTCSGKREKRFPDLPQASAGGDKIKTRVKPHTVGARRAVPNKKVQPERERTHTL